MRLRRHAVARRGLPALLALGTLLSLSMTPASAAPRPLVTGVTNVGDGDPLAFERTRATGAQFVRIPLRWGDVAPTRLPPDWHPDDPADPNYDWGANDSAVVNAIQAGLTPVLQVDGAPSWAEGCQAPSFARTGTCNPDPAALAAFATAAAQRYGGAFGGLPRVRFWQGLNEPNLSLFFNPQYDGDKPVSPDLYRTLINSFYAAVKSVDPSNLVLAAGLGPIAVPRYTIGPMRFARLLLCMEGHNHPRPTRGDCGGGVHFDIFAIQPYTTGGPTHEGGVNDVELGDLPKLQTLLRAADHAGRIKGDFKRTPLWITEFSWDSNPPDPGGLAMRIETRWAAEALYCAWRAGVSHFFWYSLHDDRYDPGQSFSESLQSGLYFRGATLAEDQPKEVLFAFRFPFVSYPTKKGLLFWGRTPSSKPGKVAIQIWRGRHWHKLTTVRANATGLFSGTAPSHYGTHEDGAVRALYTDQSSVPFSMKPVPDFRQPPFG